jgi:hypothetical protein
MPEGLISLFLTRKKVKFQKTNYHFTQICIPTKNNAQSKSIKTNQEYLPFSDTEHINDTDFEGQQQHKKNITFVSLPQLHAIQNYPHKRLNLVLHFLP